MSNIPDESDLRRAVEPVQQIESGPQVRRLENGIALCLSGGGFRAMRKHVGDGIRHTPKFPSPRGVN